MIDQRQSDLFAVLAEMRQRYPEWRFGQLIANLASFADQGIWDVEDDQLLEAARSHLRAAAEREQKERTDESVEQVAAALSDFQKSHEQADCVVYRYNPASIRIRIVDPVFRGKSLGERHDYAWGFLSKLPEDVLAQVSILLTLAPGETSPLDWDFQDPSRSRA